MKTSDGAGRLNSPRWFTAVVPALLFALVCALYAKTVTFDFLYLWDDAFYVTDNVLIRGLDGHLLREIFTKTFQGHYSPINILSYSIDYLWGGLWPGAYHLTNVFLHAMNTILCWQILNRVTGKPLLALLCALVFAVHPLNVEAVTWISQRKTLLSATFALLAFLSYLRWSELGLRRHLWLALGLFLAGLGVKSAIVGLPLVFACHELLNGKGARQAILNALPFLALSIVFSAVTMAGFRQQGVAAETPVQLLFGTVYPSTLVIYMSYLRLFFWPVQLNAFYDTTLYHSFLAPAVLGSLLTLGLTAWILLIRGTVQMRFWFLWTLFMFLPNSNIVPLQTFFADRYLYLPIIGMTACLFLLVEKYGMALLTARFSRQQLHRGATVAASLAILTGFGLSWQRIDVWKNDLSLWADTATKSPGIYNARLNYGVALEKARRFEEAEREFSAAVRIYPNDQQTLRHLAILRTMINSRAQSQQTRQNQPESN